MNATPEQAAAIAEIEQLVAKHAAVIGPRFDADGELDNENGTPHAGATPSGIVVIVEWDLLPVEGAPNVESNEWLSYHHSPHLRRSQVIGMTIEVGDEQRGIVAG